MKRLPRHKWFWMPLLGIALLAIVFSFFRKADEREEMSFGEMLEAGREQRLEQVRVGSVDVEVSLRNDDTTFLVETDDSVDVVAALQADGVSIGGTSPDSVQVEFQGPSSYGNLIGLIISISPLILFPFFLYFAVYWGVRRALRERADGS